MSALVDDAMVEAVRAAHDKTRADEYGGCFMVRHADTAHVAHDEWATSFYEDALRSIDADHATVVAWIYLDDVRPLMTATGRQP